MSDPSVDQEEAANERRATAGEQAKQDAGLIGTIERAFPFIREQEDRPDTSEEIDEIRRENDAEQRA